MKAFWGALVFGAGALLLSACATGGDDRASLVAKAGLDGFTQPHTASAAQPFSLIRRGEAARPALVVIESDGTSFLADGTPSPDPTPRDPMGYHLAAALAAADADRTVLYVARPCQYLSLEALQRCPSDLWLMGRFGREAQRRVTSPIEAQLGNQPVILIGISGGGVIAAHLASQMPNTQKLVTIAAPLALNRWAAHHGVTPFSPNDDPTRIAQHLVRLPQLHLAGGNDTVVPPHIVYEFAENARGNRQTLKGVTHQDMWRAAIPAIQQMLGD